MNRALRAGTMVLAMLLMGLTRAQANIWDWLEELNGPGPSRSRGNFMVNLRCLGADGLSRAKQGEPPKPRKLGKLLQLPTSLDSETTCVFVDQRWLHADADERFFPVNISITEVGTSVWLHRTTELGAGVGVLKFSSTNPDTQQDFSGARMTVSFPRLAYKPLLAIPSKRIRDNLAWGFLQIYFKETLVVGELNQGDFASKPGTAFSRRHQRVESMGFIVDVTALGALLKR